MKRLVPLLVTVILAGAGLALALTDKPVQKDTTTAAQATATATTTQATTPAGQRCDTAAANACRKKGASSTCCHKGTAASGKTEGCCTKHRHHTRKGCAGKATEQAGNAKCTRAATASSDSSRPAGCQHTCPHKAATGTAPAPGEASPAPSSPKQ